MLAELDDLRARTGKLFDEASRPAKRLPRQVVNRNLPVIEVRIRHSLQVLENQVLDDPQVLAHRGRLTCS